MGTVSAAPFRTGFIAVVGRPNVGKSTLVNALVGEKVAITSPRPQTTRHRVHGVLTTPSAQYIFVDTPGFQRRHASALNRAMNRLVTQALADVNVVLCVIEAGRVTAEDRAIINLLDAHTPSILVLSKIDAIADKRALLPFVEQVSALHPFVAIVPVSAQKKAKLKDLLDEIAKHLPEAAPLFEADAITDRSERFLAAEFIREKVFRELGEEVPYGTFVTIDKFEQEGGLRRIFATIVVDKPNHKAIVIGKGGEQLKRIGAAARKDMERLFGGKVYLELWVKVKAGWAESEAQLKRLGYE